MAVGCYTTLTQRANVVFEYRILEGRIEKILNLLIIFKIGGYENTMIWKKNGGYEIIFIWNFLEPEPEPFLFLEAGAGAGSRSRKNRAAPKHCFYLTPIRILHPQLILTSIWDLSNQVL